MSYSAQNQRFGREDNGEYNYEVFLIVCVYLNLINDDLMYLCFISCAIVSNLGHKSSCLNSQLFMIMSMKWSVWIICWQLSDQYQYLSIYHALYSPLWRRIQTLSWSTWMTWDGVTWGCLVIQPRRLQTLTGRSISV